MRKYVSIVLAACLLSAFAAVNTAQAGDAKPLVVLSMASYDDLGVDAHSLNDIAAAPKLPVFMQGLLRLYIEGRALMNLDSDRPWGAVMQIDGDKLSAYAFIPVKDAQGLWNELVSVIDDPADVGNGVYRIDSITEDKHVFVKVTDGWIIASDDAQTLADSPQDPGKLVNGMDKKFDFAVQANVSNIPSHHEMFALNMLKSQLNNQYSVSSLLPEKTLDAVFEAAANLDQVTLGWSPRKN